MPPKPRFTREEIIDASLSIVSEKGLEALTIQEIRTVLNCSVSPIFTVFASIKDIQAEVREAAMRRFESYAHHLDGDMPVFKQIGMQMILFSKKEPRLFQMIFMMPSAGVTPFDNNYVYLGDIAEECLETIKTDYALSPEDAKVLFEHVWIHTFGIGALCATGACDFSEAEISAMLTQDFTAMMMLLKGKNHN